MMPMTRISGPGVVFDIEDWQGSRCRPHECCPAELTLLRVSFVVGVTTWEQDDHRDRPGRARAVVLQLEAAGL